MKPLAMQGLECLEDTTFPSDIMTFIQARKGRVQYTSHSRQSLRKGVRYSEVAAEKLDME